MTAVLIMVTTATGETSLSSWKFLNSHTTCNSQNTSQNTQKKHQKHGILLSKPVALYYYARGYRPKDVLGLFSGA